MADPIEAAKRLAAGDACHYSNDGYTCVFCGKWPSEGGHAPDCPWLAMPAIIAVLEAHDRLTKSVVTLTAAWLAGEINLKRYMAPVLVDLDAAQDIAEQQRRSLPTVSE